MRIIRPPRRAAVTPAVGLGLAPLLVSGIAAPAAASPPSPTAPVTATASTAAAATAAMAAAAKVPFPGKTATQIKKIAAANAARATGVRVTGHELWKDGTVDVDVQVGAGSGRAHFRNRTTTATFTLIRIGNILYVQGNAAFWGETDTTNPVYALWVKVGRTDPLFTSFAGMTTVRYWAADFGALNVSRRYPGPKIHGVPTVRLNQPGKKGGNAYVTATGRALPVSSVATDRSSVLAYTGWNRAFTAVAPAPEDVLVPGT